MSIASRIATAISYLIVGATLALAILVVIASNLGVFA